MRAASVLTPPTFTLADRLRFQQERVRDRDYTIIGRLTTVVFEAQRNIRGLSQSRAVRSDLSPKQTQLWCSITLDWLSHKNAPILALSRDRQDLLLPNGMTPLPHIPDPRWVPKTSGEVAPRIPQLLTGCPVVGDRVTDKITDRKGITYGVLHPITELCIMLAGATGGFGRIRGIVDPADGTHLALLIDDSHPHQLRGYFVGGKFTFGGQ
jgi:hypothetical protein